MSVSPVNSPMHHCVRSGSSDREQESRSPASTCGEPTDQRPERMRDWIIRMINSGRFVGLEWLDEDKTVFKVPWIHAKKRGYCRERDAALFREWAMHSGKYRQDSDPTVWKINFRCAINGLKDIMEIKDMQTEDCRVYKVLPSRSKRRRAKVTRQRAEPYPTGYTATPEGMMYNTATLAASYHQHNAAIAMMHSHHPAYNMATPPSTTSSPESLYAHHYAHIKTEYSPPCPTPAPPSNCMQMSSSYMIPSLQQQSTSSSLPALSMPSMISSNIKDAMVNIMEPPNNSSAIYSTNSCISSTGRSLNNGHISESHYYTANQSLPTSTVHHTQGNTDLSITRQDSPDSGFGNEPQNSPQNSPLVTQSASPLMNQQNSPHVSEHQHQIQSIQSGISTCSLNAASPSSTTCNSPATIITADDTNALDIVDHLHDHPPTPPMSATPPSTQLQIRVFYGSIPVHTEYIDCKNGCRIFSAGDSPTSTSPNFHQEDDEKITRIFGPPDAKNIVLPENHPQYYARDIFNAMRRGVIIEASEGNVYVTPYCRTVVYCANSPTDVAQPLEKETRTKVFDYNNHFRPALEHYALVHSQSPTPYFILGLGQHWGRERHVAQNLISIVVTHAQAKHEIDAIGLTHAVTQDLLIDLPDSVVINNPNALDLEAEAFLHGVESVTV